MLSRGGRGLLVGTTCLVASAAIASLAFAGLAADSARAQRSLRITSVRPTRPHAGASLVVGVAGTAAAVDSVRVCLQPTVGLPICAAAVAEADGSVGAQFPVAPHAGRWTVTVADGTDQVSRPLQILPRGRRLVVLAAGDSLVRNLAWGMRRLLPSRRVLLHAEVAQGRGLTKPDGFEWLGYARETVARWKPDIVVVFVGGNEGFAIGSANCCEADWVDLLADKQRALMQAYADGGRARVLWSNLPAPGPSRPGHRTTWEAENLALESAVASEDVDIFDMNALLTPGFRFRRFMRWHGVMRKIRDLDDIHLTRVGGLIAGQAVVSQLRAEGLIAQR